MLKRWRLVSLHTSLYAVFRNLVALVITSGETTWGYRELHVSHKLEHGPQHYRPYDEITDDLSKIVGNEAFLLENITYRSALKIDTESESKDETFVKSRLY